MRTFILQTGRIEKRNLPETPFTQIHPQGVRGVFGASEIEDFAGKLVA